MTDRVCVPPALIKAARIALGAGLMGLLACGGEKDPPGGGGAGSGGSQSGGRGGRAGSGGSQSGGSGGSQSGGTGGSQAGGTGGGSSSTGGSGGQVGDGGPGDGAPSDGGGDAVAAGGLLGNPLAAAPMSLKDVGLFPNFPDMATVDARAFAFKPKHELWSNGLTKARFAVLPADKKIDTSKRDAWNFPVGALFFKTFFQEAAAAGGKPRPVETRLIRRVATTGEPNVQWEFFVYQWKTDGSDATLAEIRNRIPVQVSVGGASFSHDIPKRGDCWNCHVANKAPIIGFDELRLNAPRESGGTTTQLAEVVTKGWLTQAPAAPIATIADANPQLKAVKEYLHGNCAHCHNDEQPLEPGARYPQLDLRWDKFPASAIGVRTMTVGTADGIRIVPGKPLESILFLAVEGPMNSAGNAEVKIMPPVGVNVTDKQAINSLRQWIMSLPVR